MRGEVRIEVVCGGYDWERVKGDFWGADDTKLGGDSVGINTLQRLVRLAICKF